MIILIFGWTNPLTLAFHSKNLQLTFKYLTLAIAKEQIAKRAVLSEHVNKTFLTFQVINAL